MHLHNAHYLRFNLCSKREFLQLLVHPYLCTKLVSGCLLSLEDRQFLNWCGSGHKLIMKSNNLTAYILNMNTNSSCRVKVDFYLCLVLL